MSKSALKLVMLCRKAKIAEGKGDSAQFFRHPLKITLPPPGRNPETAPAPCPSLILVEAWEGGENGSRPDDE